MQIFQIKITEISTKDSWFIPVFCKTRDEAVEYARLTWINKKVWDVS